MSMQPHNDSADPHPWLSLLIPAYEYPEGVLRVLDRLPAEARIECCILDDSTTDSVETAVRQHAAYRAGLVRYDRNRPALGAVANWNRLLAGAHGRHILFMHHDECPATLRFFQELQKELQAADDTTLVVLGCWLPSGRLRWRAHLPTWFQQVLLKLWPAHLLRHNSWGSPSTVVVPRHLAPAFDASLKWLVDVDWYQRMLDLPGTQVYFSSQAILSIPRADHSITASLRPGLSQLTRTEARYIARRRGANLALRLQGGTSVWAGMMGTVDQFVWRVVRVLLRWTGPRIPPSRVDSPGEA